MGQTMRNFNGKIADDSILIENDQIQIGWGSTPASDLFSHLYWLTYMVFSQYRETYEVLRYYPKMEGYI